ncbi:SPASM domain-containing protein [candidate division WOR-3 bacterium]|nr:SPASM domain-containing protein [candidate division WOR-3 bacterium]
MKIFKEKKELRDTIIQKTTIPSAKFLDGYVPFGPGTICLEPTNRCNLKCKICARSYWNSKIQLGDMPMKTFKKIIPYFSKRVSVSLQMFGEPFMAPNFFEMLHISKKKALEIVINTNGTLFTPEVSARIVKEGIDLLAISIDGIKTLKSIRGIDINLIIKNIKNLNKAKEKTKSQKPKLTIAFVSMKENIEELPDMIDFAKNYGFSGIHGVHLNIHSKTLLNETLFKHKKLATHYFNLARKKAKELGVGISLPSISEETHFCRQPFESLWISWNGDVRPCCASNVHEKGSIVLGNINESSLDKIWNNERMRRLRKELLGFFPLNEYCKGCPLYSTKPENFIRLLDENSSNS